jgi:Rha family phage regulatory protein
MPEKHIFLPAVAINKQKLTVTSLNVAEVFGKQHKNILRDIAKLDVPDEFRRLNFEPSSYLNDQSKEQPAYNLTRDGYTLLVMGFTGAKAMQFKLAYIKEFNRMEQEIYVIQEKIGQISNEVWENQIKTFFIEHRQEIGLANRQMASIKQALSQWSADKITEQLPTLRSDDEELQKDISYDRDVVMRFCQTFCRADRRSFVETAILYNLYRESCYTHATIPMGMKHFIRVFQDVFGKTYRLSSPGKQGKIYGLRLKDGKEGGGEL